MGTETLAALAIGTALAGAGTATYSAVQQNKAAKATKEAAGRAASVQAKQVGDQADLERLKVMRRAHQLRARLQLASGEAGLEDFGSLQSLIQQNDLDTSLNLDVLNRNESSARMRIGSELDVTNARLSGDYRNSLLAGFEGALGGVQSGLVIGRGIKEL